jgi:YbgC/YbaW family acyl-CoA thioester hydrolase
VKESVVMGEVPSLREVSVPVTVEFDDVDSFRIAHHSRLVAYLERARLRLLTAAGLRLDGGEAAPVIYELHVRFRKPARLLDQLEVTAGLSELDDYRVSLSYRIRRDGEVLVRASSVIAFAELETGELTTVPASLREAWGGERRDSRGAVAR